MRKLDTAEKLVIKSALEVQQKTLAESANNTKEPHARAGFRMKYERVENLVEIFRGNITVTVGT